MRITWIDRFLCWLFGHKRTMSTIDRGDTPFIYCSRCGTYIEAYKRKGER